MMKYKQYDFESFRVLTITSEQFKNVHMEINFIDDVDNISMPLRSFLVNLMGYTSKIYPTKREMLIALENLYNSVYYTNYSRVGKSYIANFVLDFVSPKYIKDKKYLENCVKFLCEQVLNPNINDDKFDERSKEIIKERIHQNIDHYKESAFSYAFCESRKFLFKDSISGKMINGTHEELDSINNEDLINDYHKLFEDAKVDILIIGDLDMDKCVSYINKYFQKKSIVENTYQNSISNKINPYEELEVEGRYAQTQLLMYLQFDELSEFELYAVSTLYLQILGRANQSDKLARYLRIENPLVYSRGIRFDYPNKYLLIYTGLKYDNVKEAIKGIDKALKEMANGEIDEDYFELQKEKVLSNMTMNEDDEEYLIGEYYMHSLFNRPLPKDRRELIKQVTIDDIKKLAKKFKKTLTYILKETVDDEGN